MYIYIYPINSVPFNPMKSSLTWCLKSPKSPIRRPKRAWKGRMPSEPKCSSGPRRLDMDHPDVFGDGKPWENHGKSPVLMGQLGENHGKIMERYGKLHCFYGSFIGKKHGEIREDPLLMQVSGEKYCNLPLAREVVPAEFLPFPSNASSKCIVPKWFWGNSVAS